MQSLTARFDSFTPPSPPKSSRTRRAATPKLTWPHPETFLANPKSLAEAGFYFLPSDEDPDNAICFMCDKQLSQWEPEDDPMQIHADKCPTCPWVMVKCRILTEDGSSSSVSPNSQLMDKARLETFGRGKNRWWPHDQVKNHGALSKNMAKAGFVYTPTADPEDDTATCFFCGTILNGWEIGDDPLEEHKRRKDASKCQFIVGSKPESKSIRKKPESSRKVPDSKSKATGRKASASVRQLTEEEVEDADLTTLTVATTVKSSKSAKAAKGKRKKKTEALTELLVEETHESEPEPEPLKRPTRTNSKSRTTNMMKENVPTRLESDATEDTTQPSAPTTKAKRKKKKVRSPTSVEPEPVQEEEVIPVNFEEEEEQTQDASDGKPKPIKPKKRTTRVGPKRKQSKARLKEKSAEEVEKIINVDPPAELQPEAEPDNVMATEVNETIRQEAPIQNPQRSPSPPVVDTPVPNIRDEDEIFAPSSPPASSTPRIQTTKAINGIFGSQRQEMREEETVRPSPGKQPLEEIEEEDFSKYEECFPGLVIPRPLMEGQKIEIPRLTAAERSMTVEEWIRDEMQKQYEALRLDGERAIRRFQQQAQEVRQRIANL